MAAIRSLPFRRSSRSRALRSFFCLDGQIYLSSCPLSPLAEGVSTVTLPATLPPLRAPSNPSSLSTCLNTEDIVDSCESWDCGAGFVNVVRDCFFTGSNGAAVSSDGWTSLGDLPICDPDVCCEREFWTSISDSYACRSAQDSLLSTRATRRLSGRVSW